VLFRSRGKKRIQDMDLSLSANGVFYRTDRESVLSTILNKWFDERVHYKGEMKKAYKSGDNEGGEKYHLLQYTMKILLNSLYGATALKSFRYGNVILSESITLSGQRIIQESALTANRHMNKVIKGKIKLDLDKKLKPKKDQRTNDPKIERNISPRPYGI